VTRGPLTPEWVYGYALLVSVVGLGAALAFGSIKQDTSYGLHEVLLILGVLATTWSNGMFGGKPGEKKDDGAK
jgi:hypothetical protein